MLAEAFELALHECQPLGQGIFGNGDWRLGFVHLIGGIGCGMGVA